MKTTERLAAALISVALLALLMSGCTHAQAKSTPDAPPLQMPAPPPREIIPVETAVEEPVPPPPVDEPAPRPAARPRPTPPRAEPPKPEPPPVEPAKPVVEEPPKAPSPAGTTLQTTPTGEEVEMERSIRATLSRASADLGHVDYRVLNTDARSQYDTARRFVQQAEEAIRAKNLVFAKNLADKAAALAAQLAGI
jgi:outer membrane biosynthesis protein TonB